MPVIPLRLLAVESLAAINIVESFITHNYQVIFYDFSYQIVRWLENPYSYSRRVIITKKM